MQSTVDDLADRECPYVICLFKALTKKKNNYSPNQCNKAFEENLWID